MRLKLGKEMKIWKETSIDPKCFYTIVSIHQTLTHLQQKLTGKLSDKDQPTNGHSSMDRDTWTYLQVHWSNFPDCSDVT